MSWVALAMASASCSRVRVVGGRIDEEADDAGWTAGGADAGEEATAATEMPAKECE